MKMFIDTADVVELERWINKGIIDGVTTNPTLLRQAGFGDPIEACRKIAHIISSLSERDLPLSLEVFSDEPEEMVAQGKDFVAQLKYPGLMVKIPIQTTAGEDCLGAVRLLSKAGVNVNCTCCVTWTQAFAAAKAGARYASLLYRRSLDVGLNGLAMIGHTRELIDRYNFHTEIIAGSIREAADVIATYEAGAHIVTIPPRFFPILLGHAKSVETQTQFLRDAGVLSQT